MSNPLRQGAIFNLILGGILSKMSSKRVAAEHCGYTPENLGISKIAGRYTKVHLNTVKQRFTAELNKAKGMAAMYSQGLNTGQMQLSDTEFWVQFVQQHDYNNDTRTITVGDKEIAIEWVDSNTEFMAFAEVAEEEFGHLIEPLMPKGTGRRANYGRVSGGDIKTSTLASASLLTLAPEDESSEVVEVVEGDDEADGDGE